MKPLSPQAYAAVATSLFARHGNPAEAVPMENYMKGHFPFYGIKKPARELLQKQLFEEHGLPARQDLPEVISLLWEEDMRECQYLGMDLMKKCLRETVLTDLALFEQAITDKAWWDTVDFLASNLVGTFMAQHPDGRLAACEKWLASGNIWLQRTALLFQLKYKQKTDVALLFGTISRLSGEQDFFIRKAIGWALREYARTDPWAVKDFVSTQPLSPLSRREALKHL